MQTRVDTHIYSINKQYINKSIVTGAKNNPLEQLGHAFAIKPIILHTFS